MDDLEQAGLARRVADREAGIVRPDLSLSSIIDVEVDSECRTGAPSRDYAGCTTTDGASKNMPDKAKAKVVA